MFQSESGKVNGGPKNKKAPCNLQGYVLFQIFLFEVDGGADCRQTNESYNRFNEHI